MIKIYVTENYSIKLRSFAQLRILCPNCAHWKSILEEIRGVD